jgi:membrane protein insertase Oxa1/YidC/SpoIIIJ
LSYPQYSMGLNWIPALWEQGDYATLIAYLILPILLVVTQFVMQKWMTPTPVGADDSQAKMTQNLTLFMTLFFGFFTLQVPAGLTLYWVTSNLLQMGQQWAVSKYFQKPAAAAAAGGGTAAVTVDGKATKAGGSAGATTAAPVKASSSGANGGSRTSASGAPGAAAGAGAGKSSKPSNRPKAKGK